MIVLVKARPGSVRAGRNVRIVIPGYSKTLTRQTFADKFPPKQ